MLSQDVKYALRSATRRPAFAIVVIGTLALGVGANSAMFAIVNSVLLRPLPYARADELVAVFAGANRAPRGPLSPPDFLDYRARNTVFASMAARIIFGSATLSGEGEAERLRADNTTANYFGTLGVAPMLGRGFVAEEEQAGRSNVVVLSYGLWQRRYAGDPRIIGRVITVDGRPHAVVGVMPPVLDRTLDVQLWRPIDFSDSGMKVRRFHFLSVVARLKPGVTREVAQTQLDGIAHQLAAAFPENRDWRVAARSYQEVIVGSSRVGLLVLFGAVGVVLLIACGNVASLMLARATARQGEIAVRVALGADRGRIVRQLLTESLLYGLMGGSAGVGVALLIISAVRQVSSGILPRVAEVQLDGTALAFTLALSVVTSIVFGLAPAMHAVRGGVAAAMRAGVNISSGRRSLQFRDLLVVGQVALSLTLLVGAGLLLRSLWRLERVELGLDPEHLLTAEIVLPVSESRSRAATLQFWSSFLERVRAIPGVTSAAGTSLLPLDGGGDTYYHVVGETPATPADQRNATLSSVTAGYFETMRIPVLAGRAIAVTDGDDAPPVVVINRSMARRIFRGEQPLGRRLVVDFGEPVTAEIIGVVGDVRVYGPENDPPDIMYFSQRMKGGWGLGYFRPVVRINGDPNALVAPVRAALRELDPSVPLSSARPMEQVVGDAVARERFRARILAGFAGVALLLALLGLYGVLAYTVTQRRREIGIRIALGAGSGAVFSLVVRQGMSLVLAGVALGLLASFGATRALRSLLFEVGQADPAVLGAVIGALAISALAACAFPALRATRVDPMSSLRAD